MSHTGSQALALGAHEHSRRVWEEVKLRRTWTQRVGFLTCVTSDGHTPAHVIASSSRQNAPPAMAGSGGFELVAFFVLLIVVRVLLTALPPLRARNLQHHCLMAE